MLYFPTWGSKVSQLGLLLILFALKLCEIGQLNHMLCHNVIFCQYSLSHQCSHPPAIATTLWSLVQSFLGSCSSLLAFIHHHLLPSPTFCIIYYTLCLAILHSIWSIMVIFRASSPAFISNSSHHYASTFSLRGMQCIMYIPFSTC